MLTLAEMASRLGVPAKTVKIWYHAGLITGHPYNDKGQCLWDRDVPDGGLHMTDVWDSEQAFSTFMDKHVAPGRPGARHPGTA
jgi:hypothetical protein